MVVLFIIIENRAQEPIIPLSLFRNRIVTVSIIVTFFTGIGMFGTIIFIPLFFQGVLGATATTSGTFLMPMMIGVVSGSFISGQLLSRTGGHYRIQGAVGLVIMSTGMGLLSRITPETSYGMAVASIVITGIGLGSTLPLYMIAIQNAVPYEILGVATSSSAFFRSIGGSVGLSVFGSIMNNRFATEFLARLPDTIKSLFTPAQLESLVHNPQALVSPESQAQLQTMLSQAGPQGSTYFEQLLQILRESLSAALSFVFFIGLFTVVMGFVTNLFIKEIPLRKHH
jgi:hypothetical protein